MAENVLDCRGLACPKPVLQTKDALEKIDDEFLYVIVDNEAAKNNVTRFAESQGCEVSVEQDGDIFTLKLRKKTKAVPFSGPITCETFSSAADWAVVVNSDVLGKGDKDLGHKLMDAFIHTLMELSVQPRTLIFYNRGVLLALNDCPFIDALRRMEEQGVAILVCGTCLKHYNVEEKLGVGRVSNMFEILETISKASKVLTP